MNSGKPGEYVPIACSAYDVLEAAAVKGKMLTLEMKHGSKLDVRVIDLFSKDGAEFLHARDLTAGTDITLRLDELATIVDTTTNTVYSPQSC